MEGGAQRVPSWGKTWLSVLGCYEWEGVNPIPPELFLLPDWVPFAPWRWVSDPVLSVDEIKLMKAVIVDPRPGSRWVMEHLSQA